MDGSSRRQQAAFVTALRNQGRTRAEIAAALRVRFKVNARVALRFSHGWSQREVAERWNRRWPADPKTAKNISYWELWPGKTGYAPSLDVLDRLAQLYECKVADLLDDGANYGPPGTNPSSTDADDGLADLGDGETWHVTSCRALLRLDVTPPEAIDERVIVATADDVAELDTAISVPRHPDDREGEHELTVELLYGGRLTQTEHPHESYFRYVVMLAGSLGIGDRHGYAMRFRLPPGQLMANHFVHVPLRRVDEFDVRVRFGAVRPRLVWQLTEVAPAVIYDRRPTDTLRPPDRFGEVRATFRGLRRGYAYGLRWEYDD